MGHFSIRCTAHGNQYKIDFFFYTLLFYVINSNIFMYFLNNIMIECLIKTHFPKITYLSLKKSLPWFIPLKFLVKLAEIIYLLCSNIQVKVYLSQIFAYTYV